MHQFYQDVLEFGFRVARALEDEAEGMGPLFDWMYDLYCRKEIRSKGMDPDWAYKRINYCSNCNWFLGDELPIICDEHADYLHDWENEGGLGSR